MEAQRAKQTILVLLVVCSFLMLVYPPTPNLSTKVIFDDQASILIDEQSEGEELDTQLIIRIAHDQNGPLTSNFTRVLNLLQIESEVLTGENTNTSYDSKTTFIQRLETPFNSWSEAFQSRGRNISNASTWSEVLQPTMDEGWCGSNATNEE